MAVAATACNMAAHMTNLAISPVTWFLLNPIRGTIAIVVLVLISWVAKLLGYRPNRRTENWPTTEGTVTNVAANQRIVGNTGVDMYRVSITYDYTVGEKHSGCFQFETFDKAEARRLVSALKTQPVLVHYNPEKELESLLRDDELTVLAKTTPPA